jgi:hypothetical protein
LKVVPPLVVAVVPGVVVVASVVEAVAAGEVTAGIETE